MSVLAVENAEPYRHETGFNDGKWLAVGPVVTARAACILETTYFHSMCYVDDFQQIRIFPSMNALDAKSSLSRWMLAAARTRDADGAVAGRLPLGKIEFHTESGPRTLLEKTTRSHGD